MLRPEAEELNFSTSDDHVTFTLVQLGLIRILLIIILLLIFNLIVFAIVSIILRLVSVFIFIVICYFGFSIDFFLRDLERVAESLLDNCQQFVQFDDVFVFQQLFS